MAAFKAGRGSKFPDWSGIPVRQEEAGPLPAQELVPFEPQSEQPIPAGDDIRTKKKKVTNDPKIFHWEIDLARPNVELLLFNYMSLG
jgi:hypothetical protein